jgi:aspartate ammonia-lyase
MRLEKDFIGELSIPDGKYYGIHTARALENFGDNRERTDPYFIKAFLLVKKAAATVNETLGYLPKDKSQPVIKAIDKLLESADYSDIVVSPFSGGAGTSLNMNINEVITNYALETAGFSKGNYGVINPLDHVNMHQSTNDTYPTAFKTAVLFYLSDLENDLIKLQESLQQKEKDFSYCVKLGRTELMDALPMTVGMQFSAYAEAIGRDRWRIFKSNERMKTMNLGGTAIGTGFNAPQDYIFRVTDELKKLSGLSITRAENLVEATQNLDTVVEVSGMLKCLAVNLIKIAEDLRFMSSGPDGGIGEFILPAVQEGSSIMPGKVNPVIPEFITQTGMLVMTNDLAISQAAAKGNLELNQFYPLVSYLLLKNFSMLKTAVIKLDKLVICGLRLNEEKITANLVSSMAIFTYLSQSIGHKKASELYIASRKQKKTPRETVLESKILTEKQYDELMKPEKFRMTGFKNKSS